MEMNENNISPPEEAFVSDYLQNRISKLKGTARVFKCVRSCKYMHHSKKQAADHKSKCSKYLLKKKAEATV